jgi:hypothetical protein
MSSYTGRHVERLIRAVALWRILVAAIEKPAQSKLLTWKRLQCAKDGLTVLTARNAKSAIHEVALHEDQTPVALTRSLSQLILDSCRLKVAEPRDSSGAKFKNFDEATFARNSGTFERSRAARRGRGKTSEAKARSRGRNGLERRIAQEREEKKPASS